MISFDEFLKQDEADKYNMLLECNAIIQQKENIIKEVREYIEDTPRIVKSIHYRDKESNFAFIENEVKNELLEILDKENI